ncbi:MarR family winged helix-turn-helix transcriptional regulator [Mycoplasma sp. P36-A1]|uniref:MarR family winged helix-turn-helix transcriptional regulator n=1 Tax=Mycoplasma sp. P36-A1 TaxID=3252900 RepID=UPI003C2CB449
MKYKQLKLDNQLCFPLYALSKEVVRLYSPYLKKLNLTYTQYITMMVLWEHKHISVKKLGSKLYLDTGTLTPLLKKLEAKNYIQLTTDKKDKRSVIVTITPDGDLLQEDAKDIPLHIASCLNLDEVNAQLLYDTSYQLLSIINKAEDKESSGD